jgi:hypothetical protein
MRVRRLGDMRVRRFGITQQSGPQFGSWGPCLRGRSVVGADVCADIVGQRSYGTRSCPSQCRLRAFLGAVDRTGPTVRVAVVTGGRERPVGQESARAAT